MWGARYWANRFWARRYWSKVGADPDPGVVIPTGAIAAVGVENFIGGSAAISAISGSVDMGTLGGSIAGSVIGGTIS